MNGKLLGFVLIPAVVLGGVWLLTREDRGESRGRGTSSVGPLEAAPESPRESRAGELELDPSTLEGPAAETPAEGGPIRAALAAADSNLEEDARVWLEVTLTLPPGLPLSDQAALLAVSNPEDPLEAGDARNLIENGVLTARFAEVLEDEGISWSREAIAGNALRVPFHRGGDTGLLILQSDYLYHDPVTVEIGDSMSPVHLEPKLGGLITGRIIQPSDMEERGIERTTAELEFDGRPSDAGFAGWRDTDSRDVDVEEDGSYRVTRLSPERTYVARVDTEGLATWVDMELQVQPGEHRVLDIVLEYGGAISGVVTGDDGRAIEGATVTARAPSMMFMRSRSEATTDELGKYTITGVSPGTTRIEVEKNGWKEGESQTLEVVNEQVMNDVDFVLERGLSISGMVTWPDGRPADDARVQTTSPRGGGWRQETSRTKTLADGTFELTGLEEGAYEVRVEATLTREIAGRLDVPWKEIRSRQVDLPWGNRGQSTIGIATLDSESSEGPKWTARESAVSVGTRGVQLVLTAPLSIQGQVIDGQGNPIQNYELTIRPEGSSRWSFEDRYVQQVDDPTGMFETTVPFEGGWSLTLEAEGYLPEEESTLVTVPSGEPLTLVMNRAGKLAGMVVDPFGAPIANAEVQARDSADGSEAWWGGRDDDPEKTDEDGRFELEAPGERVVLTAEHEEFASSEPVVVELTPSELRDDLVLKLRIGATITGEVFDEEGKPLAGQNVTLGRGARGAFGGGENSKRTDASGRFAFERVDPGKVTVTAMPSQEEMMKQMAESQDESSFMSLLSNMVSETVEVEDGQEVHVTIGRKAKAPVRLFGRVTEAGSPASEVVVVAMNDGEGSLMEGMKTARTDANGKYELEVDRPGSYVVNMRTDNFGGSGVQFFIDVPEAEELEQDFALPVGRIEGRVIGPDRKPLSGIAVAVSRDGGTMGLEEFGRDTEVTAEDGSFTFEYRRPGTYALTAGSSMGMFTGQRTRFASQVVSGIVVEEDQVVSGLEIQLQPPGTLEGTVVDGTGAPVAGAAVHVRDEQGRPLARMTSAMTDPAGKFKYEGLPEGMLTVTARGDDLCSTEEVSIRIQVGQTSTCKLEVEPGAYLVVQLLDEGEAVRARLRVLNESGREVSGLFSMTEMGEMFAEGRSSRERRVGPVPPGKYTLEATTLDGKTARKRVRTKPGDDKRLIKMRLKD